MIKMTGLGVAMGNAKESIIIKITTS